MTAAPPAAPLIGGRPHGFDRLALVRSLRRHAIRSGGVLPYQVLTDMVANAAGFVCRAQLDRALAQGHDVAALDPAVLVVAMSVWNIDLTMQQASECISAVGLAARTA